jgi:hypothetical protein
MCPYSVPTNGVGPQTKALTASAAALVLPKPGPRFFGLRIDKGTTVSPDAAGAPLGPLDGRHLARDSGTKPPQAAVAQCPNDKSATTMTERRPFQPIKSKIA